MGVRVVLCCVGVCLPMLADEGHQHSVPGRLGRVRFSNSCSRAVQPAFNRAVALLHSFWYEEAEKAFAGIAASEPACGMAQWGVAMSNYHPLWAPPTAAELKRGAEAAARAAAAGAATSRERDYIAAIALFYKDSARLNHRARALAYEQAVERLHRTYPGDSEAAIFYALALLGTAPPEDKQYANQKKAAAILNGLLRANPGHPGISHYLIHSMDYPALAELGLSAARNYAKIAPDSPHALHMPSHIFTRLGRWDDSIRSNLASAESAGRHVQRTKPGAGSFDQLHAMDYLAYAWLQKGQDAKAKQVLDDMLRIRKLDLDNFAAAYAFAAIPARYTLERRRWSDAAALTLHPPAFPWRSSRFAEALVIFARGLGAARTGDNTAANRELQQLAAIQREITGAAGYDWATQVGIQHRSLQAWIAQAGGRHDEAVRLMRAAADLEDATDKHPVTPGAVLPARELLGDLLLELERPAEALPEFEAVLKQSPNRWNALAGAVRSAQLAGDELKARVWYAKLAVLAESAEPKRQAQARELRQLARMTAR
ncbi:MAG TPA: hypothetical protein VFL57_20900 [Bryobacteraceae bacterium]|nr:hypothetical protein [Bryobacteraceae bacterium]